jgi:transcriptional regulator
MHRIFSVNDAAGPLASHIPFESATGEIFCISPVPTLSRGRPLSALLAISEPAAYVSPDWYGAVDQVLTWN